MFQIQALDTDSTKGGSTKGGWQSCLAYCCRGRVLAAQGKGRDAAGAFEAAVADARWLKHVFLEAFALRELTVHVPTSTDKSFE